jgi:hypothetical protein
MLQYILPTSSYLLHSEPRLSKSLLQTQRTSWVFLHLFYRYWMFWFIGQCHSFADILFYFFCNFLILVTSKPRISRSLLQTQGTSRVFWHFSYRYLRFWFIGQCHSFADMSRYIFTTSSYLFPPKPRFSRSLIQTQLRNLKGFLAFILHIFEVQVYLEMSFFCRQVTELFYHSFILVPSKTKVYKVTTSNTRNLKSILTFILQTYKVLVYWTMSFLCRHVTVHLHDFLILVSS